jgi:hypothetical protein
MISKQKARRIAHQIVYEVLDGQASKFDVGPGWEADEHAAILDALARIIAELHKKSL